MTRACVRQYAEPCAVFSTNALGSAHWSKFTSSGFNCAMSTGEIGRLNHVAIAVPDVSVASLIYSRVLGARLSEPCPLPAHGVTVVFVELPNTKIELLEPLGATSPVNSFLERNP